jgi:FADH2-dependent halogenase/halogenation protein CepH
MVKEEEIDFFVIGAGIAGMTFHRYLQSPSIVVADGRPGRYKVGESIIPQHFFPFELRPLLAAARRLPSATQKLGTMFVSDDAVSFFHAFFDAQYTIHLDRRELEQLYRRAFDVPILEERVTDVDVARKIVRTESRVFHVKKQIVDCSGPAMILARALDLAYEVWPVWASWAYFDVHERRDDRFWKNLRAQNKPFLRFDDVSLKIVPSEIDETLPASGTTMLTRFGDGVWTWQIPLYDARLLSLGVVSRHGPIEEDRYLEIARASLGAQYEATLRPWDKSSPHNQFHRRNRFAWASKSFASPDWLLVGDAGFFGDPVYSVGTGIATNQAIRAATMIARGDWASRGWKEFDDKTHALFARAKSAYDHWYAGAVAHGGDDDVAQRIQSGFLNGLELHFRTDEAYRDMWQVAAPEDPSCDPCYDGHLGQPDERDVSEQVPESLRSAAGWTLEKSVARAGTIKLFWRHATSPPITMLVALRTAGDRFFQAAGPFGLSYRSEHGGDGIDDHGRALFAAFARRLMEQQTPMLRIVEGAARDQSTKPAGVLP